MIISDRLRFVFIHLHKTGGDSITAALLHDLDRRDFVLRSDFQAWVQRARSGATHQDLHHLRKHSQAATVRECLTPDVWASYYTFGFVRHPVDRTLSLYRYAARKAAERRRPILRNAWYLTPPSRRTDPLGWPSVRAYLETDSFSTFIRHPILVDEEGMRPQWTSLSDSHGRLLVNFVGRFERLDEDFASVLDAIGLPRRPLARHNASSGDSSVDPSVSKDDRAYLAVQFREDFIRFSYDPYES